MHVLGTVALVLAAAGSVGEPADPIVPVHIEISGNPKFSAEDLVRALAPRLPPDTPAGTLSVTARSDGMIELSWQSRKRVVDLGDESGPAAARVAALLAADLLPLLGPPQVAPPAIAPPAIAPPAIALPAMRTSTPESCDAVSLAAGYSLWSGDGHGPLLQGPALSVGLERKHLRLYAEGAWVQGEPRSSFDMTAWPLRVGAGLGASYFSLLGSLVMVPYKLGGVANLTRTLMGAGMGLGSQFPMAAGFALHVDVGADLFLGKRLQLVAGDTTHFESPLWALRFGAALAWGRAR